MAQLCVLEVFSENNGPVHVFSCAQIEMRCERSSARGARPRGTEKRGGTEQCAAALVLLVGKAECVDRTTRLTRTSLLSSLPAPLYHLCLSQSDRGFCERTRKLARSWCWCWYCGAATSAVPVAFLRRLFAVVCILLCGCGASARGGMCSESAQ